MKRTACSSKRLTENMGSNTQRNDLLDAIRGVAILVVIFGHALQGACHGQSGVTWLHRFIMSFQMEVFSVLSSSTAGIYAVTAGLFAIYLAGSVFAINAISHLPVLRKILY